MNIFSVEQISQSFACSHVADIRTHLYNQYNYMSQGWAFDSQKWYFMISAIYYSDVFVFAVKHYETHAACTSAG